MAVYVSLFRGINIGGRHLVKMDALRELHESLGFSNVASLLQSGNVVFEANRPKAGRIEDAFEEAFSFRSRVILRSAKQLAATAAACPYKPGEDKKANWIAVAFFPGPVGGKALRALEAYDGPELMQVTEREIYAYFAEGFARTKLPLKGDCTVRNWNTVCRLLKMTSARSRAARSRPASE